ncbi:hypothetical protein FKM82_011823 [Ascaphus truei]
MGCNGSCQQYQQIRAQTMRTHRTFIMIEPQALELQVTLLLPYNVCDIIGFIDPHTLCRMHRTQGPLTPISSHLVAWTEFKEGLVNTTHANFPYILVLLVYTCA